MVPLFGAIPGGPELLILLLVGIFGLLIPIGVAYWVYRDATERGNDQATLWAVATAIGGMVVFVVGAVGIAVLYVLVGRE